jgi:hypothetical protein
VARLGAIFGVASPPVLHATENRSISISQRMRLLDEVEPPRTREVNMDGSVDYFRKYFSQEGFDFPGLINDDFFAPIRLLYQNQHYVSTAKLLMTFIDSAGFIEYGDTSSTSNTFVEWLNTYTDLTSVGITSEELWEHRNSLLHMSNLDSRKVISGKVKRLMFYVGNLPPGMPTESNDAKYYNLHSLIMCIIKGCSRWFDSYNIDRSKFESFVKRYDLIVSDARMLWVELDRESNG